MVLSDNVLNPFKEVTLHNILEKLIDISTIIILTI